MSEALASTGSGPSKAGLPARLLRLTILLAVVIAVGLGGWNWWQQRQAHVFVTDARIASDMVTLSASQAGYVKQFSVQPGDRVRRGQLLAQLDADELQLRIDEVAGELARLDAERERLRAERTLVRSRTDSGIEMARATIAMAEADYRGHRTMLAQAEADRARAKQLFATKVISSQALEDAQTSFDNATERVRQSEAALTEARARLSAAQVENQRMAVINAELRVIDARSTTLTARRGQLEVRLEQRRVVADMDGVIGQTFVDRGEYLRPGARLLMMHDPDNLWVAANIKETELSRFSTGAEVRINVDAYPNLQLAGKITWIGPAATSQFALLPNPNPSGNFTKVTQRVPVRIDFDAADRTLSPGMMVEVVIDVAKH